MRRWLVVLTLIALLPWQGAAWAMAAFADDHGHEAAHAIAHWSGEAHHHHGDGFHEDDSSASIAHVVQTSAHSNAPAVLPAAIVCTPAPLGSTVPDGASPPAHPSPYLEGLRRPPRSAG